MAMEHGLSDIEALVREEKRLTAVESHNEAWAEGLSAGIEPEIIAEAALATAFAELSAVRARRRRWRCWTACAKRSSPANSSTRCCGIDAYLQR